MKRLVFAVAFAGLVAAPGVVSAQGLVRGAEQGAAEGNRVAGPVGGVVGGAIGAGVGTVNGALGIRPYYGGFRGCVRRHGYRWCRRHY